ncbi:MAG: peptide methionine sulfoxide reductase, partial [Pedobacter sp.]
GWIASAGDASTFSEAVIVAYDEKLIALENLIKVHLYTHSCTSVHSMRSKYRSAIYTYTDEQAVAAKAILENFQPEFDGKIITVILPLAEFKMNTENYQNYYFKDPEKPFCENIVNPKLRILLKQFSDLADSEKLLHLKA